MAEVISQGADVLLRAGWHNARWLRSGRVVSRAWSSSPETDQEKTERLEREENDRKKLAEFKKWESEERTRYETLRQAADVEATKRAEKKVPSSIDISLLGGMDHPGDLTLGCDFCRRRHSQALPYALAHRACFQTTEEPDGSALPTCPGPTAREAVGIVSICNCHHIHLAHSRNLSLLSSGRSPLWMARELVATILAATIPSAARYVLGKATSALSNGQIAACGIRAAVEVIKTADWIIDLGPESGDGGEIVAAGPPEEIVREKRSYTEAFLMPVLARGGAGSGSGLRQRSDNFASGFSARLKGNNVDRSSNKLLADHRSCPAV